MRTIEQRTGYRRQRGAVAVILGITLAVLIGFAGLAIDLGRFFVIKSELQNAMDACALAAASQLRPGQNNSTALTKAIAYGRVFSTGGIDDPGTSPLEGDIGAIKNRANFQSTVINIQPNQITFSETLAGPYEDAGSANFNTAAFAKCEYPLTGLPIFFMRVLSPELGTQTVSAMAAATLAPSASACAIPVGVCKSPGSNASTNFGLAVGQWLTPPPSKGSTYGTGNFGWIDFTKNQGGADELSELLTGPGQCSTAIGSEVGQSGEIASLSDAWNSRFGLYKSGGGKGIPNVVSAPPDVTGYSYTNSNWPLGSNAYSGVVASELNYKNAAANYSPYQVEPPNSYKKTLTTTEHKTLGRFRRVVVAPVVDCSVWDKGGADPLIEGWACVLMLNPRFTSGDVYGLEFLGLSTSAGSPCATNGEPGTFGPLVPQLVQ